MSLLGKILAILNVLAAAGFVCLAAMDWGQRQRWSYAVFCHDLAIRGLPLDHEEQDARGHGIVERLSHATLEEMFATAGRQPVATQVEEVERVRNRLQAQITSGPGLAEQKLARLLLPLASTYAEREFLRKRLEDDKPNPDDLKRLQDSFNKAFESTKAGHDIEARKRAIAHLLFPLLGFLQEEQSAGGQSASSDVLASTAYKRYLVIVGLEAASQEVDQQASLLDKFANSAQKDLREDSEAFVTAHRRLLSLARTTAQEWQRLQQYLPVKRGETAAQQEKVDAQKQRIKQLNEQLAAAQNATQKQLRTQTEMEQRLFQELKQGRDALRENLRLEKQIRELEGVR